MALEKLHKKDIEKLSEFISQELQSNGKIRKNVLRDFLVQKYNLSENEALLLLDSIQKGIDKSTEDEILLLFSKGNLKNEERIRISSLLERDNDWKYISRASLRHGIEPLIYSTVKNTLDCNIPPDIFDAFKKSYERNASRNRYIGERLREILLMLKEKGVDVILLKGSALLNTVYPDSAIRPMRDVDLLVKKDDLPIVETIFLLEYEDKSRVFPSRLHSEYTEEKDAEFVRNFGGGETHARVYANGEKFCEDGEKDFVIDFHWDYIIPFGPSPAQIAEMWQRKREIEVDGAELSVFSPEDMLLHLCLHLNNHIGKRHQKLIWWYDISRTIKEFKSEIDWKIFLYNLRQSGNKKHIPFILATLNRLFECNIPEVALNEYSFDENKIRISEIVNFDSAFVKSEEEMPANEREINELDYLQMVKYIKGTGNKIKYVLNDIFPSKEYMQKRYRSDSASLLYLFYFRRLGKTSLRAVKLVFGIIKSELFSPSSLTKKEKSSTSH